jgi:hypothetical protein
MIIYEYFPFSADDIDTKKTFTVDGRTFKMRLRYNDEAAFFSMDVFDDNDVFIFSNRLTYGYSFRDAVLFDFPIQFMPLSVPEGFSGPVSGTITKENLGVTVFLVSSVAET